jgi:hypothetical protein
MRQFFEWTFSTRVRERECCRCREKTGGFLTLDSGARRPLCSNLLSHGVPLFFEIAI